MARPGDQYLPPSDTQPSPGATGQSPALSRSIHPLDNTESLAVRRLMFPAATKVTIDTNGVLVVTDSYHTVEVNSGSTDNLDTITHMGGLAPVRWMMLRAFDNAADIVIRHNTGNILCSGNANITLDDEHDIVICVFDPQLNKWCAFPGAGGGGAGVTYGTPALTLGTANANGATDEAIRRDATILAFDATAPLTIGTAAAGAATVAARRDHVHGGTHGGLTGVGANDHLHGIAAHTGHANWKALYTDNLGDEQELALGAAGTVFYMNGVAAAPTATTLYQYKVHKFTPKEAPTAAIVADTQADLSMSGPVEETVVAIYSNFTTLPASSTLTIDLHYNANGMDLDSVSWVSINQHTHAYADGLSKSDTSFADSTIDPTCLIRMGISAVTGSIKDGTIFMVTKFKVATS